MRIENVREVVDRNTLLSNLSSERKKIIDSINQEKESKCNCCGRIVSAIGYSGLKGICKECINTREFEKLALEKGETLRRPL